MSIAKVTEITAESQKSFEDAIQKGIERASRTIRGMQSAWVKEQQVSIENDRITAWRVDLKITFVLDD
jgi:flavin-binding protein dodecin